MSEKRTADTVVSPSKETLNNVIKEQSIDIPLSSDNQKVFGSETLAARYKAGNTGYLVILIHGLLSSMGFRLFPAIISAVPHATLRFDFPGAGVSSGNYSMSYVAELAVMRDVVEYAKSGTSFQAFKSSSIVLVGHSKAGSMVCLYASLHEPIAAVSVSGRADLSKQPANRYSQEELLLLQTNGSFLKQFRGSDKSVIITRELFEERERLDVVRGATILCARRMLAVVHGAADRTVPVSDADLLVAAYSPAERGRFTHIIPDGSHSWEEDPRTPAVAIRALIEALISAHCHSDS